ncbi:PssE/Cps14G family polysaccharide biosynthesis glycosyltransferase [Enterococcus sp. AZ072]|uniref:PssE/Cps14G family polysaccharide biosynthesis glycosyltransferase n=1 Tax=unclassified Enterococcus TaxID=2608891 RepID=UPI003D29B88B
MIFVTLGSQKFQFNRLLEYTDKLLEDGIIDEEVFAQTGSSNYVSRNYSSQTYLKRSEFQHYMNLSNLVITHAGTGAIINALKLGKKVIAVPRLAEHGEHIDNHQKEIAEIFERMNLIMYVNSFPELRSSIKKVSNKKFDTFESKNEDYIKFITEFIEDMGQ